MFEKSKKLSIYYKSRPVLVLRGFVMEKTYMNVKCKLNQSNQTKYKTERKPDVTSFM